MDKFTRHTGVAAPMLMTNINTDLIAPSLMPGHTPDEAAKLTLREKMFADPTYALMLRSERDFASVLPLTRPENRRYRLPFTFAYVSADISAVNLSFVVAVAFFAVIDPFTE